MASLDLLRHLDVQPSRLELTDTGVRVSGTTEHSLELIEERATSILGKDGKKVVVTRQGDGGKKTRAFATVPDSGLQVVAYQWVGQQGSEVFLVSTSPAPVVEAAKTLAGAPFVENLQRFVDVAAPPHFRIVRMENPGWTSKGYGEFTGLSAGQLAQAESWLCDQGLAAAGEGWWRHPTCDRWGARLNVQQGLFRADLESQVLG